MQSYIQHSFKYSSDHLIFKYPSTYSPLCAHHLFVFGFFILASTQQPMGSVTEKGLEIWNCTFDI